MYGLLQAQWHFSFAWLFLNQVSSRRRRIEVFPQGGFVRKKIEVVIFTTIYKFNMKNYWNEESVNTIAEFFICTITDSKWTCTLKHNLTEMCLRMKCSHFTQRREDFCACVSYQIIKVYDVNFKILLDWISVKSSLQGMDVVVTIFLVSIIFNHDWS